jgi:hypothetical protein
MAFEISDVIFRIEQDEELPGDGHARLRLTGCEGRTARPVEGVQRILCDGRTTPFIAGEINLGVLGPRGLAVLRQALQDAETKLHERPMEPQP